MATSVLTHSYIQGYPRLVEEQIFSNYAPMSEDYPYPKAMRAEIEVTKDGRIGIVNLMFLIRDPETEFSLLEAIYSSSPFRPLREFKCRCGGVHDEDCKFRLDLGRLKESSIGAAKPQPARIDLPVEKWNARDTVSLHLIPLSVLNRYPGLFEKWELLAPVNIARIPKDQALTYRLRHPALSDSLVGFFKSWESFFLEHPKATRDEILLFKKQVSEQLSSVTPPAASQTNGD